MERITMSIDEALARAFDELIAARGYASRSEAMRDLLRREVESQRLAGEAKNAWCVASFSYVYNHHTRDLAERINAAQHARHDMVVSTMHVHLDHEHCLETTVLKGQAVAVRALADGIAAERGVRHAQLNLISVVMGDAHGLPGAHHHQGHMHLVPRS